MWALPMAKRFVQTDWRNELATIHDAANHHDIGDHDKPYFNPAQSHKMRVFFSQALFLFHSLYVFTTNLVSKTHRSSNIKHAHKSV